MYGANARRMMTSAKKISNRERQRLAQTAILRYEHQRLILLGILGASGGEVLVRDSDLATVNKYGDDVDYAIVEGKKPGESIVRLVVGKICTPVMDEAAEVTAEQYAALSAKHFPEHEPGADEGIPGADDAQVSA